jgi:sterol desaturase/sphingolipid hydroxylase (fatty acid hydroxylase superfamily)
MVHSRVPDKKTQRFETVRRALMFAGYPSALTLGYALYGVLIAHRLPPLLCAYTAISAALPIVIIHERLASHQGTWGLSASAFRRDAAYLLLIQIGFSFGLTSAGLWLLRILSGRPDPAMFNIWPHHWPVFSQFLVLAFASEFIGYWLHRAAHRSTILWRFHAIHHSSKQLYWLAVCRSHPCEVFCQVFLVSFPFILVGADSQALSLYLVFVCINGFYQHSNCEVRLGAVNHVVSGPEIHRWHHSSVRWESDSNYGTNLIVWDTLFGTRLLPPDRIVAALGPAGTERLATFAMQIIDPFKPAKAGP